ncbi:MAG: type II toxin-antitoxin system VapC family toxin [Deferrisomatales bacterium]|nr:type II toxin-antitoxin system VapC family toxin [Deferrisomatales bacterium]
MPGDAGCPVIYWDASAILSCLVQDVHTRDALARLSEEGYHLVSSLAFAEVHAVLSRIARAAGSGEPLDQARQSLSAGPWSSVEIGPDRALFPSLAARHRLRGADLWYLATALTLRRRLPEITLLSYDRTLGRAAAAEGL